MPAKPETLFLDLDDKNIQLVKGGEGPPLVYLHSAGGETEWMPFHAALAERYTVYAPAHPGFSVSTGLDEIDNMVDLAWHYVDLFAQLGLSNVPVVGFSLGAWLGAQLAILRPELVSKLVLTNAAGLHVAGAPMADLFIDDFEALKHLVFFNPKHESVDLAMPSSIDDPHYTLAAGTRPRRAGLNPFARPQASATFEAYHLPDTRLVGPARRIDSIRAWRVLRRAHPRGEARHDRKLRTHGALRET